MIFFRSSPSPSGEGLGSGKHGLGFLRHLLLLAAAFAVSSCDGTPDESLNSEVYEPWDEAVSIGDASAVEEPNGAPRTLPDLTGLNVGEATAAERLYAPVEVPEVYMPTVDEMLHGNPWPRLLETEEELRTAERQIIANEIASGMRSVGVFHDDVCTNDCSGHDAGYDWAAQNDIEDPHDCGGSSLSFEEGCRIYAEEQRLGY